VPVKIGDMQLRLADGGFERHKPYNVKRARIIPAFVTLRASLNDLLVFSFVFSLVFFHRITTMIIQPASRKRCATCNRWAGPRSPARQDESGGTTDAVEIGSETDAGLCIGGPWDGTERRARSACGQWIVWHAITPDFTGKP
jgi:hypothetical protein